MAFFPYQTKGAGWLASSRTGHRYLGWEPGLGKSATAILACDKVGADNVLILSPAVGRENWRREASRWQSRVRDIRKVTRIGEQIAVTRPTVLIVSHDLLSAKGSRARDDLLGVRWDVIVPDEAHVFANMDANRTKFLFAPGGLASRAKHVFPLSGTPAQKHAGELYPVLRALHPAAVRGMSRIAFENRYCRVRQYTHNGRTIRQIDGTRPERIPELRAALAGFLDVKRVEDVLSELPALRTAVYPLSPDDVASLDYMLAQDASAAAARINAAVDKALAQGDAQDRENALAQIEVAFSTERRLLGVAKAKLFAAVLEAELSSGAHKSVVFVQHKDAVLELARRLGRFGAVVIDGDTSPEDKTRAQDRLQNDPLVRVAICQIRAASVNLTLTAATRVDMVEWSTNPGVNDQAIRRVRRIGQTKPVLARFVSLVGPDDRLAALAKDRADELQSLFSNGGQN